MSINSFYNYVNKSFNQAKNLKPTTIFVMVLFYLQSNDFSEKFSSCDGPDFLALVWYIGPVCNLEV